MQLREDIRALLLYLYFAFPLNLVLTVPVRMRVVCSWPPPFARSKDIQAEKV